MKYEEVKRIWETKDVHGDLNRETIRFYSEEIQTFLDISNQDSVLDIGCGDGRVDEYIIPKVKHLSGFDFSESKIKYAAKINPRGSYWVQSFLDPIAQRGFNKVFSFSVMQYCKPKDIYNFLRNSIECCNTGGRVVHVDVPDRRKIAKFYISKSGGIVAKLKGIVKFSLALANPDRLLFEDGSYWVDFKIAQQIVNNWGYKSKVVDSWSDYRSHFIIYL